MIAKGVFGMSEIVAIAKESVMLFKGHYTSGIAKISMMIGHRDTPFVTKLLPNFAAQLD